MSSVRPHVLRLRRRLLRHRRPLAAALAAGAVVAAVQAASPPPRPTSPVVVAARDLGGGSVIGPGDVRVVAYDPKVVPADAAVEVGDVIGSTVAGPMGVGEPMTRQRVLGEALLAGYGAGLVAAPVRIHDAEVVALLRVGDHIDVYAANGDPTSAADVILTGAEIAALPAPSDDASAEGALAVLMVAPEAAATLAQAAATTQLSVTLRG